MKTIIFALFFLFAFTGCTKPVQSNDVIVFPDEDVIEKKEPAPQDPVETEAAFKVEAPKNIVDAVHQVLGDSGSLPPTKDLPIVGGGTKVTIHPGATIDYFYNEENNSMRFVFNEPRPTVEAGFSIFKIRPPLLSLVLTPDNVGTATVQTAIGKVERRFSINWDSSEPETSTAAKPEEKKGPVFVFHTTKGCAPCEAGKKALEEAKKAGKLPFDYEVTDDDVDYISPSRPLFTCDSLGKTWTPVHSVDDPATGAKKGEPRPGWFGLDDAIQWWKMVPKDAGK